MISKSQTRRVAANAEPGVNDPTDELEVPLNLSTTASFRSTAPSLALAEGNTGTQVKSVLIVDDVAMNRDVAGANLCVAGYDVICVSGGAEAIVAVKAKDFDVVLMDVRMPSMDGLEATRRIRALGGRRGLVPIVALTAQDFPEQIAECRKAGTNGDVSKPFDPDKLVVAVARATLAGSVTRDTPAPKFIRVNSTTSKAGEIGAELPVVDAETFKCTASFLAGRAVASYLQTITALAKSLLAMLDGPDTPDCNYDEHAGAAHEVAGTAGMFGFERLTVASRQFERATESGGLESPRLREHLSEAIEDTPPEIHSRMLAAVDA